MDILQIKCIRCGKKTDYPLAVNHLTLTPPSRTSMPPTGKTYYLQNGNFTTFCDSCYRQFVSLMENKRGELQLTKWKVDILYKLITEQLSCTFTQMKQVKAIMERCE